jgi:hypothetical protein
VVASLAEQLDLERLGIDRNLVLYRNTAFSPAPPGDPGAVDPDGPTGAPAAARGLLLAQVALWLAVGAVALRMRFGVAPPEQVRRAPPPGVRRRGGGRHGVTPRSQPAAAGAPGRPDRGRPPDQGAVTVGDPAPAPGTPAERLVPAGGPEADGEPDPGAPPAPAGGVPRRR